MTKVRQGFLADIGNVTGNLFRSKLGITCAALKLFNVNGRIDVVTHQSFIHQDRILKVVTAPGHEGDEEIAAQSHFPILAARSVCQDLVFLDLVTAFHDRGLVETGSGIGTHELA